MTSNVSKQQSELNEDTLDTSSLWIYGEPCCLLIQMLVLHENGNHNFSLETLNLLPKSPMQFVMIQNYKTGYR